MLSLQSNKIFLSNYCFQWILKVVYITRLYYYKNTEEMFRNLLNCFHELSNWMEPLPGVFDMLQYFETILPLVESLWSS